MRLVLSFSLFETIHLTPTSLAALVTCSDPYMVHSNRGIPGAIFIISRAASMPFITGIEKSRTTQSGRNARNFSTACRPLVASPQTLKSARASKILRIAARTKSLSSTMSIVVGTATQPLMLVPPRRWPRQTCVDPLGPRFITDNSISVGSRHLAELCRAHRRGSTGKVAIKNPVRYVPKCFSFEGARKPATSRKHPPAGECWIVRVSAWIIPRYLNRRGFVFTIAILAETADWFNTALCPLRKVETTLVLLYSALRAKVHF